jgi:beta-lactamase regulating signal transducer with metallopeptidase domain
MHESLTWLESIGAIMWSASWHAAVLAVVVVVVVCALRGVVPAGPRSLLWLVVFIRLAMPAAPPSVISFENVFGGWRPSSPLEPEIHTGGDGVAEGTIAARDTVDRTVVRPRGAKDLLEKVSAGPETRAWDFVLPWRAVCLIGWLIGLAAVSLRYTRAALQLRRLIGRCGDVDESAVLQLAEECRRECGLAFAPAFKRAPQGIGATVVGLFHPVLLLSEQTLRRDRASLRFILLHEMRHIRVGDCWFAWWIRATTAIHWFNPLVWLSARAWQAERELACDAWVLRRAASNERRQYGTTLLSVLEETSCPSPILGATAMASRASLMERRIKQVNRPTVDSNWRRGLAFVAAAVVAATGLTGSVGSAPVADSKLGSAEGNRTEKRTENRSENAQPAANDRNHYTVIVAKHVLLVQNKVSQNDVLTDWKLTKLDQLDRQLFGPGSTRPAQVDANFTIGSLSQLDSLQKHFVGWHQAHGANVSLAFVSPNGSNRYDAIRAAGDLRSESRRRREGTVRLADGRPAAGAIVVIRQASEYACCIYLERGTLRDRLDEAWTTADSQGRFVLYPKDDKFAVAALHPLGIAAATSDELQAARPLTLTPWARIDLTGDGSVGLGASRTAKGKQAVHLDFQSFPNSRQGILVPSGRVSVDRFLGDKLFDSRKIDVAPGQTTTVEVESPKPVTEKGASSTVVLRPFAVITANGVLSQEPGFDARFKLTDGQTLKHVSPPFPAERGKRLAAVISPEQQKAMPAGPDAVLWMDDGHQLKLRRSFYGGMNLQSLVETLTGYGMAEVEGPAALWMQELTGDFVVRRGATREQLLGDLEGILRELKLGVSLRPQVVERDVYLAHGKFDPKPAGPSFRPGRTSSRSYLIYGASQKSYSMKNAGDYDAFLKAISLRVGRRVVDESANKPHGMLYWTLCYDEPERASWETIPPIQFSANADRVLERLTAQTGLSFVAARRKIQVVILERRQ